MVLRGRTRTTQFNLHPLFYRLIGESPVIDSFSIYELVVSFFWFVSHGKYGRRKRNSRRRGNKNSFESSCSVLDLDLRSGAEEVLIIQLVDNVLTGRRLLDFPSMDLLNADVAVKCLPRGK
ncbi:hypothetical protein DVH24_037870 [Malus domestica]|uniref:Uncharacterized protein n=1 Tax=Malus domestica TaxID=3750 RepID=A0A498K4T2_MALDO|nr:hypothetical protein DVH24_037870 [Malus domestica]